MKKIITVSVALSAILMTVLLCACSVQRIGTDESTRNTAKPESTAQSAPQTSSDTAADSDDSTVGAQGDTAEPAPSSPTASLYIMTHSDPGVSEEYAIVSQYEDDMSGGRDLCVLGAFPSDKPTLSGKNMGDIWYACLAENGLSDTLRPGFLLEFDTPAGKCEKLILGPSDITDAYWDYIETYIYDDIHQTPGAWYSHLTESEFTDETIVTSVKITAGAKISDVDNLTLTVFLYDVGDRDVVDTAFARANGSVAKIIPNSGRG